MIELTLNRGVEVKILLTAEEIADMWWNNMSSDDQARFFNHLGRISARDMILQLLAIMDDDTLSEDGRLMMQMMGKCASND